IWSPLLTEVTDMVKKINLEPGKDYKILTISFDDSEKPELAAKKKKNYLKLLGKSIPDDSWKFLTGDNSSIQAFTDAVGYKFKKKEEEFVHPAALIMLSPEGKITRYLYGTKYLPFDIKMALIEAGEGKVGPTINRFLNYCFNYDPQGRTYALNITRVVGAGMLFLIAVFVVFLVAKPKKNKEKGN
ncbi:MAG: SCO family protein, partial [Ignavibacteria bacterium]|nr:SCO family protein [Ignavibacteria bacterium]